MISFLKVITDNHLLIVLSSYLDDPTSLEAYFTVENDWALLNHVIKDIWTSSEIVCAMFCLRDPNCQSFNFKCGAEDSNQYKNVNTQKPPNCELNVAKHLAHTNDFIPRKGYCYFHVI